MRGGAKRELIPSLAVDWVDAAGFPPSGKSPRARLTRATSNLWCAMTARYHPIPAPAEFKSYSFHPYDPGPRTIFTSAVAQVIADSIGAANCHPTDMPVPVQETQSTGGLPFNRL
jgi:hypothetical protein